MRVLCEKLCYGLRQKFDKSLVLNRSVYRMESFVQKVCPKCFRLCPVGDANKHGIRITIRGISFVKLLLRNNLYCIVRGAYFKLHSALPSYVLPSGETKRCLKILVVCSV